MSLDSAKAKLDRAIGHAEREVKETRERRDKAERALSEASRKVEEARRRCAHLQERRRELNNVELTTENLP